METTRRDLPEFFTTPELAKRWRVKQEKVRGWIMSGELLALNLASKAVGLKRPRYRIPLEAVLDFEQRRAAAATRAVIRRRARPRQEPPRRYD